MNTVVVAVAGAGKTTMLARAVAAEQDPSRVAVLTYTMTNQVEDAMRVASFGRTNHSGLRVMGWCAFLLNEIVRPYLPALYPNVKLAGLAMYDPESFKYLHDEARYFNKEGFVYPSHLGKLANDIIKVSHGAPIKRLENVFETIYVDEAQDIRGNDLCVLEKLLHSNIEVHLVLDPRQSTLTTTSRDTKYKKKYEAYKILDLYRLWERKGLLAISYENETHRSSKLIARLSDVILGPNIGLSETVSNVVPRGHHDGVFLISKDTVTEYSFRYNAALLAQRESDSYDAVETINFGKSKGLTRDDIIVIATQAIEDFLVSGKDLQPTSACGFYVAVTRARYSIAIAVNDPAKTMEAMNAPNSIWHDVGVRLDAVDGSAIAS